VSENRFDAYREVWIFPKKILLKARRETCTEWVSEPLEEATEIGVRKGSGMDYGRFILRDPQVCGGEPVIAGTRVTIRTILASLAAGASIGEILRDFPALTEEQVMAVIAFAAASAEEDLPVPGIPKVA
jgi:uncharacterized protein (DUF433 family)